MKKSRKSKRSSRKRQRNNPPRNSGVRRPTLVLRDHLMINQNVSGVNVKQINLAFSLSNFPDALTQSTYYEQYRLRRVTYKVLPLDVINSNQLNGAVWNNLDLVYSYTVPLTTSTVPAAAESAYLAFKNVKVNLQTKLRSRAFSPFYQTGSSPNYVMVKSPRLDCANSTEVGYGQSILFIKKSATATTFLVQIFVEAQFEFFTFDGNFGMPADPELIKRQIDEFSNKKQIATLKQQCRMVRKKYKQNMYSLLPLAEDSGQEKQEEILQPIQEVRGEDTASLVIRALKRLTVSQTPTTKHQC